MENNSPSNNLQAIYYNNIGKLHVVIFLKEESSPNSLKGIALTQYTTNARTATSQSNYAQSKATAY